MTKLTFTIFLLSVLVSVLLLLLALLGIIPPIFFIFLFIPFISTRELKPKDEQPPLLFCPRCGYPLSGTENYCPRCGYKLR